MTSIAASLGIGSGIDTAQLVSDLAAAQKGPKEAQIAARETANTAKVSTLAGLASGIDGFATALTSLISGGSLYTQPTSSNAVALGVSAVPGGRIGGLAATVRIDALALAQTIASGSIVGASGPIGQGNMTLTTSRGTFPVSVGADNDSLAGLARAINSANAGVAASVVSDTTGSRLVIKGAIGAAGAFTLTAAVDADPGLAAFTYDGQSGGGMTLAQKAQDASILLDGVTVTRGSNTVSDLIPGVKLELKAVTTAPVSIASTQPVAELRQAVLDFVGAYNELKSSLDSATSSGLNGGAAGPLRSDSGVREMVRQLGRLTSTQLVSSGSLTTLADLGVRTGNDGKLSVNTTRLDAVLAADPAGVEAMFNPTQSSSSPLLQITSAIGAATPGTYTITNVVAGPPPSGKIGGLDMIAGGARLIAPIKSGAGGLILAPLGAVASATIIVEPGLAGALQQIRDAVRTATGPLTSLSDRLKSEAKSIAKDRAAMELRADAYEATLRKNFTTMETRVSSLKATQSYLEQQVKVWTNSNS
ncbi:MAG: flagellar hook-associated 2 protein [Sphingomonas bacterium]|nr:flagellar filament capping protein FliD [Sphingomonas bacterium]MDB5689734.1 flagellar hook-associated 2 protein [Sphingomonas bacterium]